MRVSELFPSNYVSAADLKGKDIPLRIKGVTLEEMRTHNNQQVRKPVVWFANASKGFVLNATNARTIAKLHGDEMDAWAGKHITLYPARVRAFGETVEAIRVRDVVPAHRPQPQQPQAVEVEEPSEIDNPEDYYDADLFEPEQ